MEIKSLEEMTPEELHAAKCVVHCIKTLNELADKGIVTDRVMEIQEDGLKLIEGFEPTQQDIELGMEILIAQGIVQIPDELEGIDA